MATYISKRPYVYGTGRRKSSVARVHLIPGGSGVITINGRGSTEYFVLDTLKQIVRQPLAAVGTIPRLLISNCTVSGRRRHLARPAPSAPRHPPCAPPRG